MGEDEFQLLHVAPEAVIQEALRSLAVSYSSVDLTSSLADVHADITRQTPFPDGSFDLIICSHVLEHVHDDRAAIRELRRLASAHGTAVILVPLSGDRGTVEDPTVTDPAERLQRFWQEDHVRLYGDDITERLEDGGWSVERISVTDVCTEQERNRFGLRRSETLFLCRS